MTMLQRISSAVDQFLPRILIGGFAVALVLLASVLVFHVGELSKRGAAVLLLALGIPFLAVASGHAKRIFLVGWVVTLAYNKHYFSFDPIFGDHGAQGIYWIPSDFFLVLLVGIWLWELAVLKRPARPKGPPLWPWLAPFAAVCFLSTLNAEHVSWGASELVRIARLGLILLYLRYNLTVTTWGLALAALGGTVLVESILGGLQVAAGTSDVLPFIGGGRPGAEAISTLAGDPQGWHRASGTLVHPLTLSNYLELVVPAFVALGLAFADRAWGAVCAAVGIAGLLVLGLTLSRAAWLIAGVQVLATASALIAMGRLGLKRAIGIASVTTTAALIALVPVMGPLQERITRDLGESFEVRAEMNRIALGVFAENPVLGLGPNNLQSVLPEEFPEAKWIVEEGERMRKPASIRVIVGIHNLYLHLLAEVGIVGLGAFVLFVLGALRIAFRAVRSARGPMQIASVGMLVGMAGVLAHQATDFSLWLDPVLYTFALLMVLLNAAPALRRGEAVMRSRS